MKGKAGKLILVGASLLISVIIYLLPRTAIKSVSSEPLPPINAQEYFAELQWRQENNLNEGQKQQLMRWKAHLTEPSPDNLIYYDSIAFLWDQRKMYGLSAYWYEKKAGRDSSESSFLNAAYRYFDAIRQAVDTNVRSLLVQKAIEAYNQVITLNPHNLNARTDLGILYAENSDNPMKGINLLLEVIKEDPQHEMAQLNLGLLSVRSGQLEKALDRFDKVLSINPSRIEVHLYKAHVYMQQNQNRLAADELKRFIASSTDQELIAQARALMEELRAKNN
jgi:tetratricopeptide (TPR) repeat protein